MTSVAPPDGYNLSREWWADAPQPKSIDDVLYALDVEREPELTQRAAVRDLLSQDRIVFAPPEMVSALGQFAGVDPLRPR